MVARRVNHEGLDDGTTGVMSGHVLAGAVSPRDTQKTLTRFTNGSHATDEIRPP